jgi:hypothetical protein
MWMPVASAIPDCDEPALQPYPYGEGHFFLLGVRQRRHLSRPARACLAASIRT